MNYRNARRSVLGSVEDVGKRFTRPDDDWLPVLILHTADGVKVFGTQFTKLADKEAWPHVVAELFREHRPTFAAMVTSAWIKAVKTTDPLAGLALDMANEFGVRDDPQRQEIVMVQCSDGEKNETWTAPIQRHPKRPPTLGEWKSLDMKEGSGRFADVLKKAFAENAP